VSNHVKVADFGLVSSLRELNASQGINPVGMTPRYTPPEILLGMVSRYSDQYSLAVVYQELLTGSPPFRSKNSRQLVLLHTGAQPELGPLPEADRAIVARALAKDPQQRFPSCVDFVRALIAAPAPTATTAPEPERNGAGDPSRRTNPLASCAPTTSA